MDFDLISIEDYSVMGEIEKDFYIMALKKTDPKSLENDQKMQKLLDATGNVERDRVPIRRFKAYLTKMIE